jgi:plastocyanin
MNRSRLVSFVLSAVLAGCGGSDASAPSGGGQVTNPPTPGTVAVNIQDFSYSPATVTVKAGTTVRWTNRGPSAHTTVSDTGLWDSKTLASPSGGDAYGSGSSAGGSFQFTFTQPGTYSYHCSLHPPSAFPNFTGTVTVTP